jgi:DNA mismatch endonuclease (patch repair protein)
MANPHYVSESRRRNMAAIKPKNTKPEMAIRRFLHGRGFRYRLHRKSLPGRPDIVLKKLNTAIFVHGCFWHHHGCSNSVWPKTRAEFWRAKILGNRKRDRKHEHSLTKLGWKVVVVWECEVEDPKALRRLLATLRR